MRRTWTEPCKTNGARPKSRSSRRKGLWHDSFHVNHFVRYGEVQVQSDGQEQWKGLNENDNLTSTFGGLGRSFHVHKSSPAAPGSLSGSSQCTFTIRGSSLQRQISRWHIPVQTQKEGLELGPSRSRTVRQSSVFHDHTASFTGSHLERLNLHNNLYTWLPATHYIFRITIHYHYQTLSSTYGHSILLVHHHVWTATWGGMEATNPRICLRRHPSHQGGLYPRGAW